MYQETHTIPGVQISGINKDDDCVDDTSARFRLDEAAPIASWIVDVLKKPEVDRVEVTRDMLTQSEAYP
jgi:hypothetical protein